jgi:hypothetical protein|tara:strand:- start:372 stop:1007 length:636 start_codon:yes stop_codon:yes gene_type:complete
MVIVKPAKPWKNIVPKPDPDRLITLDSGNVGSKEKTGPGVEYAFDADRRMIDEVAPKNNFAELVEELKGKGKEAAEALFSAFGTELMEKVAETGEKYKDRAWEMIETCAEQTGISFPHVLQAYAELFTLCSRPIDKWAIVESHTSKMRIQQYSCNYLKAQEDACLSTERLPCQVLCLSAFGYASKMRNIPVTVELTRQLPVDKMCEFTFAP